LRADDNPASSELQWVASHLVGQLIDMSLKLLPG
jgi:hypothetical protein